eukprot:6182299-Pleurochrysis_carterae.AAC.1
MLIRAFMTCHQIALLAVFLRLDTTVKHTGGLRSPRAPRFDGIFSRDGLSGGLIDLWVALETFTSCPRRVSVDLSEDTRLRFSNKSCCVSTLIAPRTALPGEKKTWHAVSKHSSRTAATERSARASGSAPNHFEAACLVAAALNNDSNCSALR